MERGYGAISYTPATATLTRSRVRFDVGRAAAPSALVRVAAGSGTDRRVLAELRVEVHLADRDDAQPEPGGRRSTRRRAMAAERAMRAICPATVAASGAARTVAIATTTSGVGS